MREKILLILPLLILLPALNDMAGDYGTILASKFTTWLYRGVIPSHWYRSRRLKKLIKNILLIAFFYSSLVSALAILISFFQNFPITPLLVMKIFLITVVTALSLVTFLALFVFSWGTFVYRKGLDPDNSLIPFATATADFGVLLIFSFLVGFLF